MPAESRPLILQDGQIVLAAIRRQIALAVGLER
jgi:hypothetical protein